MRRSDSVSLIPGGVAVVRRLLIAVGLCLLMGAGMAYASSDLPSSGSPRLIESKSVALPAARKAQRIRVDLPATLSLATRTVSVPVTSSSKLPVSITSRSPNVCKVRGAQLRLFKVGVCNIEFTQPGSGVFAAAKATRTITVIGDNRILVTEIATALLSQAAVLQPARATSGLAVIAVNVTPTVCSVVNSTIQLLAPGQCTIDWQQPGGGFYPPAAPVRTDFKVLASNAITFEPPARLPVSAQPFALMATASSGQPVGFLASPASVCSVSGQSLQLIAPGNCVVTAQQDSVGWFAAAAPVTRSVTVTWPRNTTDQPDVSGGYQLHFVYVVPADGVDRGYDTDGTIKTWIDEGQAFMQSQLGLRFPIDTASGVYDIQFLKSRYTAAQLTSAFVSGRSCDDADGLISREIGVECISRFGAPYTSMKYYVYLVDVPDIARSYCGYAGTPGNVSVVAVGPNSNCSGPGEGFKSWVVKVWLHEVFHGLGIEHAPSGACDLMSPGSSGCKAFTIDSQRRYYVGTTALGVDILTLNFWIRT